MAEPNPTVLEIGNMWAAFYARLDKWRVDQGIPATGFKWGDEPTDEQWPELHKFREERERIEGLQRIVFRKLELI